MPYEHDVFLSYSRHGEWPEWVREKFLPLLRHWLGEELGREANVFFDQEMEAGQAWPQRLQRAVTRSRALVPLWSRMYFASDWCLREMSMMVAREAHLGFGTRAKPGRLVVPAAIHDGDDFPEPAIQIHMFPLQHLANVRIANGGLLHEQFDHAVREWTPSIKRAINRAPAFDETWQNLNCDEIIARFRTPPPIQNTPPIF
jgi:hypothetical protein